jgi:hypothetical protein
MSLSRALLEEYLARAERHVAERERTLARERERVAGLERDGRDATSARDLQASYERILALHIAERDRLRESLDFHP